jgi:hypothetical protein
MKDWRIVYIVWHAAGGIDGRDSSVHRAPALVTFDEQEANDRATEAWYEKEVEVKAVDMVAQKREALMKLSLLDKLALGIDAPAKVAADGHPVPKHGNPPRW